MRLPTVAAIAAGAVLLLAGCATGPSQPERVAAVRQTWDTTTTLAQDALSRIETHVIPAHPELTFTASRHNDDNGAWRACHDEVWQDTWDGPDESRWRYTVAYHIDSRQASVPLVDPLVRSYLADGWTVWNDYRDQDSAPWVDVVKDGYLVRINSSAQAHLDAREDREAYLSVTVTSPCVYSPDNLTEWDRDHPDDYSFVTEAPPQSTW